MALSAFDDEATPPSDAALKKALGRTSASWMRLKDGLHAAHGPLTDEWGFPGKAYGWSLRIKDRKKRAIVHMTPCRGHFLASFALGEKACAEAHERGLPAPVLAAIDAAPRYAEGRGVRMPVRSRKDVERVEALIEIKLATR